MDRSRPAAALLASLLAIAPLAGCSSSGDDAPTTSEAATAEASPVPASASQAGAAAPADWPSALPFYGEGTLEESTVEADGTTRAVWSASGAATTALRKYGELLVAAGFEFLQDGTVDGIPTAEYSGNGYSVVVQAVGLDGVTSVSIEATPS
jgi:hypothetical protein